MCICSLCVHVGIWMGSFAELKFGLPVTGPIWYRQKFPKKKKKWLNFSPLVHKLLIPNSVDPPKNKCDIRVGRPSKFRALPAVGIGPILAKSSLSSFWTFLGRKSSWGALQKPKFAPGQKSESGAPSTLALAFHFIFDVLSAYSRSKLEAFLAKTTTIKFYQAVPNS